MIPSTHTQVARLRISQDAPSVSARDADDWPAYWQCIRERLCRDGYRMVISEIPKFNALQVFLASICLNPIEHLTGKWERTGEYNRAALIDAVRRNLATDDDIIQQWFEGPEVMKLIEASQSFDEMLLAIRAIGGEHETDQSVLAYVERILGKREDEEA